MFRESHVNNQFSMASSFYWMKEEHRNILATGWSGCFRRNITEKIDENPYAVLYSNQPSRPNAPIRVQIGMMLLEALLGMTETEVRNGTIFDMQIQYALGIESTENIDISERTLQRFRSACLAYESKTGVDLLHDTIVSLAKDSAEIMGIDGTRFRMDSLMVESNIKTMTRIEILFQVSQDLAFAIAGTSKRAAISYEKQHAQEHGCENRQQSLIRVPDESPAIEKARNIGLPESLFHLLNPYDANVVLYHSKNSYREKQDKILADIKTLMEFCAGKYEELPEYALFARAVEDQCKLTYLPDETNDNKPYTVYVLRT